MTIVKRKPTAKDSEGRQVQQELERQLRELGDTMSDAFRHGFEGRGEEIGDRVWDVGRAAWMPPITASSRQAGPSGRKQEYQKRAEEARSSASAAGCRLGAQIFCERSGTDASENLRHQREKVPRRRRRHAGDGITFAVIFGITAIACFGTAGRSRPAA